MSYKFVLARCSACGLTKKLKPEEVPGPGKCLPCTRCLGIFDIVDDTTEKVDEYGPTSAR